MTDIEFLEGFKLHLVEERGNADNIELISMSTQLSDILEDSLELYSIIISMEESFNIEVDFSSLEGDSGLIATVGDLHKSTVRLR
jgi:acyl carrier protein